MKVVIGLSGGVDSSVAAYLLKQKGYEVIGITYKMLPDFDISDAKKVADELGIEFHVKDITNDFKTTIINNFINEYKNGLTPNPCILCNKKIKFKYLYESMIEYNADMIATGHYAKIIDNSIYKSNDLNKDQSYFLYTLDKEIISKLMLPLDTYTKEEIRKIAIDNNLITAHKKDSYDVCFIKDKFSNFIKEHIKEKKGKIIHLNTNKVLGTHNGLSKYTIGQRRGINIGFTSRLFVVKKDIENNILYVSNNINDLYSNKCIIKDVIIHEKINKCTAKFRYRQEEVEVELKYLNNNKIEVSYNNVSAVTVGQSCVFYLNDKCLGGGIIEKTFN